ncbi:hypothetical protein BAR24066_01552 [Burkholderia arboris]|uniref:Uncharacterized protein n=1 Tax=Burkholderia arboris TaxID=488730 RepID=A0A9Q9SFE5_9BURK|nr:hypothetical protein [Burkholderia arboris]VWB35587.1 hypothetical protein BAR24066_01552 [Burkholderia arboris]
MKFANNDNAGPLWGVIAGLILAVVGLSMGFFPKLLHSAGVLNDFVASGVAMMGIFLVVYAIHELRRQRPR